MALRKQVKTKPHMANHMTAPYTSSIDCAGYAFRQPVNNFVHPFVGFAEWHLYGVQPVLFRVVASQPDADDVESPVG